jgi:hypothetical protein
MRLRMAVGFGLIGLGMVGCGGGGSSGGNGPATYSGIANSLAHPTGKLAASNANGVAKAFEQIDASAANGRRIKGGTTDNQTVTCPAGGSYTISVSGGQTSGQATLGYDQCCYTEGCCINGSGNWYYSTEASASYSMCGSYSLSISCDTENGTVNYQGCMSGSTGDWTYVVTVEGKTYAVSGNYNSGSGTLQITDSAGTYTCTYNQGVGSCTGSAGTFSF